MSVSSIATTQQIQAQQAYRPPPSPDIGQNPGNQSSTTGATQGSGGTNPFAKLVTDLQSALVSMQEANGTAATTSIGTTTTATSDPMATLKSDLQSIVTQFQSGGSQGANGGPQGVGGAHPHHHHHKDNDAQVASTQPSSSETSSSSIVESIMKAFQSVMPGGSAAATSPNTASLSLSA